MIERHIPGRASGFSLLEVLVAFAVLSTSLTVILGIYSTSFRSSSSAENYRVATQLAESKLREIAMIGGLQQDSASGVFADQYAWQATVRPVTWRDPSSGPEHPFRPYEVAVSVSWGDAGRAREVTLTTVQLTSVR